VRRDRQPLDEVPDAAVFEAMEMIKGRQKSAKEISDYLNKSYGLRLTRQQTYDLIGLAEERGFLDLRPPEEQSLRLQLARKYQQLPADTTVVDVSGRITMDHVAYKAAVRIAELIHGREQVGASNVTIGFGAGSTMARVARALARILRRTPPSSQTLTFVALSQGFVPSQPGTAPTTFLPQFDVLRDRFEIRYVGLFAEPMMRTERYQDTIDEHPIVKECFQAKNDLDIVVSSCASSSDPHALLRVFLDINNPDMKEDLQTLRTEDWQGDVMFRPFSHKPIDVETHYRAVTLFDLEDLVAWRKKPGKHAIFVVGPCAQCGRLKTQALKPLLTQPALHVCGHLFLDSDTARDLL
jgi:DNA-binding transcriptional regulator LsrR (DeoR family)